MKVEEAIDILQQEIERVPRLIESSHASSRFLQAHQLAIEALERLREVRIVLGRLPLETQEEGTEDV